MATTHAEHQRRYRKRWPERVVEQQRRYRKTDKSKARSKRHKQKYPEKVRARNVIAHSIASGKIVRPGACEWCSAPDVPIEASHSDYARPLDVEWLCRPCHMRKDGLA